MAHSTVRGPKLLKEKGKRGVMAHIICCLSRLQEINSTCYSRDVYAWSSLICAFGSLEEQEPTEEHLTGAGTSVPARASSHKGHA